MDGDAQKINDLPDIPDETTQNAEQRNKKWEILKKK